MPDRVGQQIDNYRLIRLLGKGGFADVYLAEHIRRHTPVAVKILRERLEHENIRDFLNEARSFRLKHPHIIQLLDFGLEDDIPFLVMEYAPNGSLRKRHPKGSQVPVPLIIEYVRQIADALQYAHDEGLVHRDIKPDNLLLNKQNEVLVSDFGIASIVHNTHSLATQDNAGTINYMAPEQLLGKPRPASDQYALGIVVYEWLRGERPFHGSFVEIQSQQLAVAPPPLSDFRSDLPDELVEVVMKALAKDPRYRFPTIQGFASALEQASLSTQPSPTLLPSTIQYPSPPLVKSINHPEQSPPVPPTMPEPDLISEPGIITFPQPRRRTAVTGKIPVAPPATPPARGGKSKHIWQSGRRWPIILGSALLLLILLGSGIALAAPGMIRSIGAGLGLTPAAVVTITPASTLLNNTYQILAVIGTPNPTLRQVQARVLTTSASSQPKTVVATGVKQIPAVQATGTLTFYNGNNTDYLILANTQFTDAKGVQVENDAAVDIPAGNPPKFGSKTVSAHAIQGGVSGNIAAQDFNSVLCCGSNSVFVSNLTAFTGGVDPQDYTVVQQSDIDGVVNPQLKTLTDSAKSDLQNQIKTEEKLVNDVQCANKVTSDHNAGDQATSVTINVTVTCTGEVYDEQGALMMGAALLQQEASDNQRLKGYALVGNILPTLVQASVVNNNTIALQVMAEGEWVYQFTDIYKQHLAALIAGKSKSEAESLLLQQPGVGKVGIVINAWDQNSLPGDPGKIQIVT